MTQQKRAHLDALAQHTAAQVKCSLRRWWVDEQDATVLHVEVERTLVGARPVIVDLTVPVDAASGQPMTPIPPSVSKSRRTATTAAAPRPIARPKRTRAQQAL